MPRREVLGLAALATLTFVAYAWSAHFWIDPVDEGYFLDLADRVTRGELPYRDFTTYYTPGIFYLFAATFKLFGPSLLWPRYVMALLRAATAVLTYLLVRRVAPWPFAVLPIAATALLDNWPIAPEPHPSWPAIVLCLATLELTMRHACTGRLRWLGLAGAAAGLSFLFKQNTGAFTAVALGAYVVLRPRARSGLALKALQLAFALSIAAAVTAFLSPLMDGPLAVAVWLPVLIAMGVVLWAAMCAATTRGERVLGELAREALVTGACFTVVTLAWLIPLAVALGPANVPIRLFLGGVDQASIATRFPSLLPIADAPRDPITTDPELLAALGWLDQDFGTLHVYLPALAAWAGIAAIALSRSQATLRTYVVFGTLASLTIFPRTDTLHALVAGPPIFIAGAAALGQLYCATRRAALVMALLILPVVAIAPQVAWRVANVIAPEKDMPRLAYTSLEMDRAPVSLPSRWSGDIRRTVDYISANTPPGEPFFAYPVEPIFNFLAERPNPTRFDHFLPGTLTPADYDEVLADLQRTRPRYVLWNHYNVLVWGTDPTNRPISDYIWRCYEQVEAFNLYLVLERRPDGC